ncbi:MAG TPA: PAS domain-containing protein [Gemmatimonadales bacterium]|nr:PAS domain-containing protein [Gemmatimonadales bacterium]
MQVVQLEPSLLAMRDNHRPKQDLIHEVTGLRKQIVDLKEAMVARRRVEEALRETESRLRSLTDGAPVGLCLFRRNGTPLASNAPFARMLGYESPAELQRVGAVLGIFTDPEEQARVLAGTGTASAAFFRHKEGCRLCFSVLAANGEEQDTVALVIHNRNGQE